MRNRYLLAIDIPLVAICAFLAFALRFDLLFLDGGNPTVAKLFWWYASAALVLKPPIFLSFGLYSRYWRSASIGDLLAISLASSAAALALAIVFSAATLLHLVEGFSRSVLLIDWLLTLAAVGGMRLSVRVLAETSQHLSGRAAASATARRVLVVGAGNAGTMVAREMRRNPQLGMTTVGFLDDDAAKVRKQVAGLPVLGATDSLTSVLGARQIDEVIIAMPTAPGSALRQIAERCREAGVPSRVIPGVFELLGGAVSVSRLRQIEIADLLRRAPVVGESEVEPYVTGQTVLVTGAGGSIGYELCRQVATAAPSGLILLGHGENSIFDAEAQLRQFFPTVPLQSVIADIRDEGRIDATFRRFRPSVVFHAAAHKHVPLMEDNPQEAITNNVFGTVNVVRAAQQHGAKRLVFISTDKAVAPTSIMGASKRLGEAVVRDAARRSGRAFVSVRFGNVLGSRGSVVPFFKRQIESGGPVTITHPDMRRFFMTIPEAVHLVLQAGGMDPGGELFVLNMGEPVRILDLAHDLIRLSGLDANEIPIVYTGLRPGEKLDEALWESDARVERTSHPEVLRVAEGGHITDVDRMLADLQAALRQQKRVVLEATVAEWVETFAPPPDAASRRPTHTLARAAAE